MQATVQKIGKAAINEEDGMIILFGPTATTAIEEVAVIIEKTSSDAVEFKAGKVLRIADENYTIEHVGALASDTFNQLGHLTLVFKEVPEEDQLLNVLYLSPNKKPKLTVGSIIEY